MQASYLRSGTTRFRDRFLSLDFQLIFLVMILGIISFFAMYSTERGNFNYYTESHIFRFCAFFLIFIAPNRAGGRTAVKVANALFLI